MGKTVEELVAQAASLKEEADRLLDGERLLACIASYGPTKVIGSYALDLMTWRDLDINVQIPDGKDVATFFQIGDAIATRFDTIRAFYSNMFLRTDQEFDSGLYRGIRMVYEGQTWKIDLWGYGEAEYADKMAEFQQLHKTMAAADRSAVLRVKDEVWQWEQYRMGIYSVHIYDAVANHGVKTVDEFCDWLKAHVPEVAVEPSEG